MQAMQRSELTQMFREMAAEIGERNFAHVTEADSIASLGIDSLGMLELVGSMERRLEVTIPDDRLVGVKTVGQFLGVVEAVQQALAAKQASEER